MTARTLSKLPREVCDRKIATLRPGGAFAASEGMETHVAMRNRGEWHRYEYEDGHMRSCYSITNIVHHAGYGTRSDSFPHIESSAIATTENQPVSQIR